MTGVVSKRPAGAYRDGGDKQTLGASAAGFSASRPTASSTSYRQSGYDAVCASCGANTTTIFIPDGIRPVYCKDCLARKKEEKRVEIENRRLAKEAERRRLAGAAVEENLPVTNEPTISLEDLKNIFPVDFKGKIIKTERPAAKSAPALDEKEEAAAVSSRASAVREETTAVKASGGANFSAPASADMSRNLFHQEKEIAEGEEIIVNN
jgi:CxxC-x17-CxxC domain-containing protein